MLGYRFVQENEHAKIEQLRVYLNEPESNVCKDSG